MRDARVGIEARADRSASRPSRYSVRSIAAKVSWNGPRGPKVAKIARGRTGWASSARRYRTAGSAVVPFRSIAVRRLDQIAKKPTVAAAITTVASQPVSRIGGGSVSRPMIRPLVAISMMIAINGAARTPFTTALQ